MRRSPLETAPSFILIATVVLISLRDARSAEIEFLGKVALPGTTRDLSRLAHTVTEGSPQDRLGGFSGIDYDSRWNRYLVLSDRGPGDGAVAYQCRFHEIELAILPGSATPVVAKLMATRLLQDERRIPLIGLSSVVDQRNPAGSRRFDPEGIRIGKDGTVYLSDEYGPHLFAFSRQGCLIRRLAFPAHFPAAVAHESAEEENRLNSRGRQSNRGLEGLAISADGRTLYAMMQGPLLQDSAFDENGERLGKNARLLEFDLIQGRTREMVYALDHPGHGISEIALLEGRRFLVLERDNKSGAEAKVKRLYAADFTVAADVSDVASLPADELPAAIRPATKQLFLDLLDPGFGLAGSDFPGKIEGVAFGPTLADGRRLLIICADNDYREDHPSWIFAFAVGKEAGSRSPR